MTQSYGTVMRRSVMLWLGAALVIGFSMYAAHRPSEAAIHNALAFAGAYALSA